MLYLYTTVSTQIEQRYPKSKRIVSAISVIEEGLQVKECEIELNTKQRNALLIKYEQNHYPTMEEKVSIANDLGVSSIFVNLWFLRMWHQQRNKLGITRRSKSKIEIQSM